MKEPYVVVVDFKIRPDRVDEFRKVMLEQAASSLDKEEGCHYFDVAVDPGDPAQFHLYEIYADEQAFAAHRQCPHYHEFIAASTPLIAAKTVRIFRRLARD